MLANRGCHGLSRSSVARLVALDVNRIFSTTQTVVEDAVSSQGRLSLDTVSRLVRIDSFSAKFGGTVAVQIRIQPSTTAHSNQYFTRRFLPLAGFTDTLR